MKKISFLLTILLIFSTLIIGCNNSSAGTNSSTASSSVQSTAASSTAASSTVASSTASSVDPASLKSFPESINTIIDNGGLNIFIYTQKVGQSDDAEMFEKSSAAKKELLELAKTRALELAKITANDNLIMTWNLPSIKYDNKQYAEGNPGTDYAMYKMYVESFKISERQTDGSEKIIFEYHASK